MAPHGYIPPNSTDGGFNPPEGPIEQMEFYQEDGLQGTFVIDLGNDFEITLPLILDEITNPKDLEILQHQNVDPQKGIVEDEDEYEYDEDEDEEDEDEELQPPTYDPNDF